MSWDSLCSYYYLRFTHGVALPGTSRGIPSDFPVGIRGRDALPCWRPSFPSGPTGYRRTAPSPGVRPALDFANAYRNLSGDNLELSPIQLDHLADNEDTLAGGTAFAAQ